MMTWLALCFDVLGQKNPLTEYKLEVRFHAAADIG